MWDFRVNHLRSGGTSDAPGILRWRAAAAVYLLAILAPYWGGAQLLVVQQRSENGI